MSTEHHEGGPRRRPDVESLDVDGELVLWDPASNQIHLLDPIASTLWPMFDGSTTIGELAVDAAEVWQTPVEVVAADLERLVDDLVSRHLLTSE